MNINDILNQSVKSLMTKGLTENESWLTAYTTLVDEGILTHLYTTSDKSDRDVETFYIFAHSANTDQDYTYISARYHDGVLPISISLYDHFYDYLVDTIDADVADGILKQDMLDGLSSVFAELCVSYVKQINTELIDRLKIYNIPSSQHVQYFEKTMHGLRDIFHDYKVQHLQLNVNNRPEFKYLRGIFEIKNTSVKSRPIYWDIDKDDNSSIVITH